MRHISRPWFVPMLLAIGMATWTVMIGCHGNQYHVIFIERSETPKIRRIELRSESLRPVEINVNTATQSELMTLPTIGEVKAQRIRRVEPVETIEGRPYQHVADLWKLEGFGEKTMASLRDKITVH